MNKWTARLRSKYFAPALLGGHLAVALAGSAGVVAGCSIEEAGDTSPQSPDGLYLANNFAIRVEGGAVVAIEFRGFGCLGSETAPGQAMCSSLLSGNLEIFEPLATDGSFNWDGGFGLTLQGQFQGWEQASGEYAYEAANDCCVSQGTFVARADTTQDPGGEPCQPAATGTEALALGTMDGGDIAPFTSGEAIPAVSGIQGAIMITAGLRVQGASMGGITAEITAELPTAKVSGRVASSKNPFRKSSDGVWEWRDAWIVLQDETGRMLSPTNSKDVALISGAPVIVSAKVNSSCGLQLSASVSGGIAYGSGFE